MLVLLGIALNAMNASAADSATSVPFRTIEPLPLTKANLLWSRVVIGILSIKQLLVIKTTRKVVIFRKQVAIGENRRFLGPQQEVISHLKWQLSPRQGKNTTI
jgi:hypothetical protein